MIYDTLLISKFPTASPMPVIILCIRWRMRTRHRLDLIIQNGFFAERTHDFTQKFVYFLAYFCRNLKLYTQDV